MCGGGIFVNVNISSHVIVVTVIVYSASLLDTYFTVAVSIQHKCNCVGFETPQHLGEKGGR